jgi:hypothetical protein
MEDEMRRSSITHTACALAFGIALNMPIAAYAQIDPGNFAQVDPGDRAQVDPGSKVDPDSIAQVDPGNFAQIDPGDRAQIDPGSKVDSDSIAQVDPGDFARINSYGEHGYFVDRRRLSKVEIDTGNYKTGAVLVADWEARMTFSDDYALPDLDANAN